MTKLADLLDLAELETLIEQGYVRVQQHPTLPLFIYNYTERCQFDRFWTPETMLCRGLIATGDGEVVARPFSKFFNYGEHPEGSLDLHAPAQVTDKMDGSLGIMYPTGDWLAPYAIATRGSFASEQALHAMDVLHNQYLDFRPPRGMTCLFEIIYPANRIVCNYRGVDDLFLLGAVNIETGETFGPGVVLGWDGPVAEVMPARTLASALALPPRPGAEGVVVRMRGGTMVKIKQDDYVSLHKLVTGLNARAVWERLGAGESAEDICVALPDEFHQWVREIAGELVTEKYRVLVETHATHLVILAALPDGWTRKDYAAQAVKSPYRPYLFMLLDGRDPSEAIWKTLRPSAERTLVGHGEDVA